MARAAARSLPSSKRLEWGRNEPADLFFFIRGNVANEKAGRQVAEF
jgi:hypothetical protein